MKITSFEVAACITAACGLIGLVLFILHSKRPESVSLDVALGFISVFLLWASFAVCNGVIKLLMWAWSCTPWGRS